MPQLRYLSCKAVIVVKTPEPCVPDFSFRPPCHTRSLLCEDCCCSSVCTIYTAAQGAMHRSAQNGNSRKFAPDSVEWHHACGGRARPARDHTWGLGALTRKGGHVMEARTEADTFTMVALSRHRHRPPHANSPSLSG